MIFGFYACTSAAYLIMASELHFPVPILGIL